MNLLYLNQWFRRVFISHIKRNVIELTSSSFFAFLNNLFKEKIRIETSTTLSVVQLKSCRSLPPATKLQQGNVFTHVCHSVHGGVCHTHPRWADTPWADTPPPRANIPPDRHPLCAVHAGIRSTSGRYASYWNAFLFKIILKLIFDVFVCLFISPTFHSQNKFKDKAHALC